MQEQLTSCCTDPEWHWCIFPRLESCWSGTQSGTESGQNAMLHVCASSEAQGTRSCQLMCEAGRIRKRLWVLVRRRHGRSSLQGQAARGRSIHGPFNEKLALPGLDPSQRPIWTAPHGTIKTAEVLDMRQRTPAGLPDQPQVLVTSGPVLLLSLIHPTDIECCIADLYCSHSISAVRIDRRTSAMTTFSCSMPASDAYHWGLAQVHRSHHKL